MNALYAGSLGIAVAVAGSLADPSITLAAEPGGPEPTAQPAANVSDELVRSAPEPARSLSGADAMDGPCHAKCKVLAFTEKALPGFGASQILGVLLYPEERGVSIENGNGTPALTFTVMPTHITRGRGLVAIARF